MSIALDIFCFDVPFRMILPTVLSISTGVGSCEWTIYDRAVRMDVAFWQFSNNLTNSASVADAMTFLIIMHYICTGPFFRGSACIGVFYFDPRGKYPPALLRASGSDI